MLKSPAMNTNRTAISIFLSDGNEIPPVKFMTGGIFSGVLPSTYAKYSFDILDAIFLTGDFSNHLI